jgi:hypothetical protein
MSPPTHARGWAAARAAARAAAAVLLAAPLAAHAYVGLFTRYMADDYCTAAALRLAGLLGMQRHFYAEWSGRFSFTLTVGLVETLGTAVVPYLPAALLAAWLAALAWAARGFGLRPRAGFLLAGVILFATLDDNKGGVSEALYWQTGSLTYALPLVILTTLAGHAARASRRGPRRAGAWRLALFGGAALYAGGFSETSVVMQTAALCVALAVCLWRRGAEAARALAPPLGAALLGSLLALAVVALAPGNQARRAGLPAPRGLAPAAASSVGGALAFVFSEHNSPGTAHVRLVALLLPLLFASHAARVRGGAEADEQARPGDGARALPPWLIPAGAFFVIVACFAPSFYVMSREPPPRALVVPQFVLACALAAWGYALGSALRRARAPGARAGVLSAALAAALLAAPAWAAARTLRRAGKARALAAVWDRQDALTRAAVARGERRLTVPVLYNVGGTDLLKRDPGWYVNACAAAYYGAESVTAVPGGEGGRVMFGEGE